MINLFLANIIKYIHYLLIFYILVGHQITPIKYLKYYLYIILFIFLGWNILEKQQCWLTILEHKLKTTNSNNNSLVESEKPEFFRPLVKNLFNINITSEEADRLNYVFCLVCFIFGFNRLLNNSILIIH